MIILRNKQYKTLATILTVALSTTVSFTSIAEAGPVLKGAARGAIRGAVIGQIVTGDPAKGARIGATVGGIKGNRSRRNKVRSRLR
jgi:hypothetical protein